MALIVFLAIALTTIIILMTIKKRMRIMLIVSRGGITFCMAFWWFRLVRSFSYKKLADMIIDRPDRKKAKVHLIRLKDFVDKYELTSLTIRGRVGIPNDAACTAILCGMLQNLAQSVFSVRIRDAKKNISIKPDFARGIFWLYLEGILIIYPGKIIVMLIRAWLKEVCKKWRIRSKTLWKRQWQNSRKWSM